MADTRFKQGESGNPAGRPRRKALRSLVTDKDLSEIVKAMAAAARGGDVQAARLLLPPVKPELQRVVIRGLETAATHTEKAAAITAAAARGEISPDAAAALSTVLANSARVIELDEVVRRLEALEAKAAA